MRHVQIQKNDVGRGLGAQLEHLSRVAGANQIAITGLAQDALQEQEVDLFIVYNENPAA
jgi:hypothetical protein